MSERNGPPRAARSGGRGGERGAPRRSGPRNAPDGARLAAYEVLRRVADSDAYANLVLPGLLRERGITGRDAGFATELAYGTLRMRGRYDAILQRCTRGRSLTSLDAEVLDLLRLGAHQILGMRVPVHAAVSETVALTRQVAGPAPTGIVNAVLRTVAETELEAWLERLGAEPDPIARLSVTESHPEWVVRAFRQALIMDGTPKEDAEDEVAALLRADNAAPRPTLVARPGLIDVAELSGQLESRTREKAEPGRFSPYAVSGAGGDPARLPAVREARAGVQDEGSQLVALALASAPLGESEAGSDERWLDLCAGPGGKAALLAALAHRRGAVLTANEVAPHRAELVRKALAAVPQGAAEVLTGDGRDLGAELPGRFDRVLVDAPCTGLGALRRRPESRWRRAPADLGPLGRLQRDLLGSAVGATRRGGVIAYVTCSPHVAETRLVVEDVLRGREDLEALDAAAVLAEVAVTDPELAGPWAQLWPHRHGTDAMFLALLRRR